MRRWILAFGGAGTGQATEGLIDFSYLGFKHGVVLLENGCEKFWQWMIRLALGEDGHLLIEIVGVDDMGPGLGSFVELTLAKEDDGLDFTPRIEAVDGDAFFRGAEVDVLGGKELEFDDAKRFGAVFGNEQAIQAALDLLDGDGTEDGWLGKGIVHRVGDPFWVVAEEFVELGVGVHAWQSL